MYYGFCSIDLNKKMKLEYLEKLASWASRYSIICCYLKPFVYELYFATIGIKRHALIDLNEIVKLNIEVFRAIFIMAMLYEMKFTSFGYFIKKSSDILIEFDASLYGGGCLVYQATENSDYNLLGAFQFDLSDLNFGNDSSFQNLAEFITAILSLCGTIKLLGSFNSVSFRGDSVTALQWCHEHRFKSIQAKNSSFIFIMILLRYNIQVDKVIHISSEENWKCDVLSRSKSFNEIKSNYVEFHNIELVNFCYSSLLNLCNPFVVYQDQDSFLSYWNHSVNIINNLSH